MQSLKWLHLINSVDHKVTLFLFPDSAAHLIQILDITVLKPFNSVLKHCVSSFMLENANSITTKKYAITVGSNIGEKLFNLKLQIVLLDLEQQVCGLCILIPCSSGWRYLRTVVSHCQRRIRFGWGIVRLSKRRCCHYHCKLIYYQRWDVKLMGTTGCCQENS